MVCSRHRRLQQWWNHMMTKLGRWNQKEKVETQAGKSFVDSEEFRFVHRKMLDSLKTPEDSSIMCVYVCDLFSHVSLFATPQTVVSQDPLSMQSSRKEYWSGVLLSYLCLKVTVLIVWRMELRLKVSQDAEHLLQGLDWKWWWRTRFERYVIW